MGHSGLTARGLLPVALVLALTVDVNASTGGFSPELLRSWRVTGSADTTGATLMESNTQVNYLLLPSSTASINSFPADGVVTGAFLFWSGSTDFGTDDRVVTLTRPDGVTRTVDVDTCSAPEDGANCNLSANRCVVTSTPTLPVFFYYCRRDVTNILAALPAGGAGGSYTVGNVEASPGVPDPNRPDQPGACDFSDPACQAKFAGWSLVVAWRSPTATKTRDAVLWDGFFYADEDFGVQGGGSGISQTFRITGFNASNAARAELSFFALEGDAQLGAPPHLAANADFMELSTASHPSLWRVTDGTQINPAGNLFNSSNKNGGSTTGVDVDTISIGQGGVERVISASDTYMDFRIGSGDGIAGGELGGGELFLLGYVFVALDSNAPRLFNAGTFKSANVTQASPGDIITFTIRATNDGTANANNVVVKDTLPTTLLDYIPNSTTTSCGVNAPDVGGASPLFSTSGLNIGQLTPGGTRPVCEVSFQARVKVGTADGTVIQNTGTVDSDEVDPVTVSANVTVRATTVNRMEKTVSGATGGGAAPGDTLTYTITVFGNGSSPVSGVTLRDVLPAQLQGIAVTQRPNGSVLDSDVTTGTLQVSSISVPASGSVVVTFTARIREGTADNTSVSNQAQVTQPGTNTTLFSDDPTTTAAADPTTVITRNRIDLSTSSKTLLMPADGNAGPGEEVRWSVRVANNGNRSITVDILDDLPVGVNGCTLGSAVTGVSCQAGGANGTGRMSGTITLAQGAFQDIVIVTNVANNAANGSTIQNSARLTPQQDTTRAVTVTSPSFTVTAMPVLAVTKTVQDLGGTPTRPGDAVRYTITVINNGNRAATSVVVTDAVDNRLTITSVGQNGSNAAGNITWSSSTTGALASLAQGTSTTLTFDATVNAGVTNGATINNTATVDSAETSPLASSPPTALTVTATPLLTVEKTVQDLNGGQFRPGDNIRYTMTLRNRGDGVASTVAVLDTLPSALDFVSASNGGTLSGGAVRWNLGNINTGAANDVTLTLDARLKTPLDNGLTVSNQSSTTATELTSPVLSDDPSVAGTANPTNFAVTSAAVLTLTKLVGDNNGGDTLPGDVVTYTLVLTNTGDAPARNVVIEDPVDARLISIQAQNGGIVAGQLVTYQNPGVPSLLSVVPGPPVTVVFTATVSSPLADGTVISNRATARADGGISVQSDDPTTGTPNDATNITIRSRPRLSITKRLSNVTNPGSTVFRPGDRIAYDLAYTNSGTETATNVVIRDTLDANLVSVDPGTNGQLAGATVTYDRNTEASLASMPAGRSGSVRILATVRRPLNNGTVISNRASIQADGLSAVDSDNPDTATPGDATTFTVTSSPTLVVTKTVTDLNGAPFAPGDNIRYDIRVQNTGSMNATNVVVTDPVDGRLLNLVPSAGGNVGGGGIRWDGTGVAGLQTLAVDTAVDLSFTATLSSPLDDGTQISNQARVTADGVPAVQSDDPNTATAGDATTLRITSAADLSASTKQILDGSGNPITTARPGDPLQYRITVTNRGNAIARNVVIEDPLPAEWITTSADNGGVISGNLVSWTSAQVPGLASVSPGNTITVTISGRLAVPLDDGITVGNQAQLFLNNRTGTPFLTDDPTTATGGDQTRVTVRSTPTISNVQKTFTDANGGNVEPGDQVTYTVSFTNNGTANARQVAITDVVDTARLEVVSVGNGGTQSGNLLTWNLASVSPGNTPTTVTFTARVLPTVGNGTTVSNQASVAGQGITAVLSDDPSTPAANDATTFRVVATPRLAVTKSIPDGNPRVVPPLTDVTYVFSVTNPGSATATTVRMRDEIPEGMTFISATGGGVFDSATRTVNWTLPDVAPFGGEARVELVLQVLDLVENGRQLHNQAFASAQDVAEVASDDPSTGAANDPTTITVNAVVDLSSFTKTAQDENLGTLVPGDVILYRLTISNTGNTAARTVTVTDELDAALEVVEVGQGGTASGNLLSWTQETTPALTRLRPTDPPVELTIRARVKAGTADGTRIPNQATVRSLENAAGVPSDDPGTGTVDDATIMTVAAPRLAFTKSFDDNNGAPTIPGDRFRYTLVITNSGSAPALQVVVTDPLPAGFLDVTLGQQGVLTNGTARWDLNTTAALASIEPNGRVELWVDGRVDPLAAGDTSYTNRASLTAVGLGGPLQSDDPRTAPVDATVFTLQGEPSFTTSTIVINNPPATVEPGDTLWFTITVRNSGTSVTRGVSVSAPVDASLTDPIPEDGGTRNGAELTWDASNNTQLALMRPGDVVTLRFRAQVRSPLPNGTNIRQVATARSVELPGGFTMGPATIEVTSIPRLSASSLEMIDVNSGEVEPGDLLNFRLTVVNDGSAAAHTVRATMPIPAGTEYVAGTTRVGGAQRNDVGNLSALAAGEVLGGLEPRAAIVATFQVRALLTLPRGYRISAQGWLESEETTPVPSDDPRTPEILGDPTQAVVGGGAILGVWLQADPSIANADGTSTLRLVLENPGSLPAHDALIRVPIPNGVDIYPQTLTLNGAPISAAADNDAGGIEDGGWWIRLPVLESGDATIATVRVRLNSVNTAQFQAEIKRTGAPDMHSDADPASPGDQPTVLTRAGSGADVSGASITVVDLDGGLAEPGDELLYMVQIPNRGATEARLRSPDGFLDALDSRLTFVETSLEPSGSFQASGDPTQITLKPDVRPVIPPGGSLTIRFRALVSRNADAGTELRNGAVVVLEDGTTTSVGPAVLVIGAIPGTADLRGSVFEDVGKRNKKLDGGKDKPLVGYQVLLVPLDAGPRATPIMTALTDESGRFHFSSVAPGDYRARIVSQGGAQFAEHVVAALTGGERRVQDLGVDPSGVVYDSRDGRPLAGVTAILYVDNEDDDPNNDVPVAEADLPEGQQNQVTGTDGRYRFDPRPGKYRVGLTGPSPTSIWPSTIIPPANDDNVAHPMGSFARTFPGGNVVDSATPQLDGDRRYYLRFDLTPDRPVFNNHIPVDPLLSHVRLQKLANKRTASVGDIITYTVRATNTASRDMTVENMGGVELADAIPPGFKLLPGSARVDRLVRDSSGRVRREKLPTPDPQGNRLLTFGPFDLLAKTETEIRYQLVVGPSVKMGEQVNRAVLRAAAGQVNVSNEAEASVDIRPEPIFDDGVVLGKVFCDQNGDGWQDPTEEGVYGARVYLDTGYYAETDLAGRFHFSGVRPGSHLAKIDDDTLPAGAEMTTLERQLFYVTRGLPTRFSFGVRCVENTATNPDVTINEDSYRPLPALPPPASMPDRIHIRGVASQRNVSLLGARQESVRADLGVSFGNDDPIIGQGPGPNLMAFDDVNGLGMKLWFHPRVHTSLPLSGWRLVVEEEQTHEAVYVLEGQETPAAMLSWDGRDEQGTLVLKAGRVYLVTLAAVATNGDLGVSAPRRFGIRAGDTAPTDNAYEAVLDESTGPLFDETNTMDRRVQQWLKEEAPKLGNPAEAHIQIEVHGDDRATEQVVEANQARAERVKAELAALGFVPSKIDALGVGGERPAVPNLGRAQRAMNRRIVLRSRTSAAMGPPVPAYQVEPRVLVNGQKTSLDEETLFDLDVPLKVGDMLQVDMMSSTGQRSVITRMYTGEPFPEGAPPPPGSAGVEVKGDIATGQLLVGDQVIPVAPSIPVGATIGEGPQAPFNVDGSGTLDREVAFRFTAPAETLRWTLRVVGDNTPAPVEGAAPVDVPLFPADEVIIHEEAGDGAPPPTFNWSGRNAGGAAVLRAGKFRYRLTVELPAGVTQHSPDGTFTVVDLDKPVVITNPFDKKGENITSRGEEAIRTAVAKHKKPGGTMQIQVHTEDKGPKMKALFLTQRQADQVKDLLVVNGVPEAEIIAVGRGSEQPISTSKRNRNIDKRVELIFSNPPTTVEAPPSPAPARVEVNGVPLPSGVTSFNTRAFVTRNGEVVISWRDTVGGRVVVKHKPALPAAEGAPPTLHEILGPTPAHGTVLTASAPEQPQGGDFVSWDPTTTAAGPAGPGGIPMVFMVSKGVVIEEAPPPAPTEPDPSTWMPNPREVGAASLVVDLPPDGTRLGNDKLLVRGITHPLNVVSVNGQPAVVDPVTGQFVAIVKLNEGDSAVTVETTDVRGNKGTLTRRYNVDLTGFFLMGFADTGVGAAGAQLDEHTQYNMVAPVVGPGGFSLRSGPVFLYGRGAAYAKARWKGFWRIPFFEATLHIDTSRWNDPVQQRDLLAQDMVYYPTYGDNGVEVQEARARYPVYAKIRGGNNELFVGNALAQLQGGDLFRYSRSRYAGMATIDQGYVKLKPLGGVDLGHTRARLLVAGGDTPRRPAHVELRGTGGSLYFLKDRDVVEGSERVYIVIRDAVTAQEIARIQKVRGQDYVIRYREGRIMMNDPIPSTADATLITNQNPTTVTTGNPVFLVIDYEHEGTEDFSEVAVGGTAEQTVLDHFAVGGGYVFEGRRNHSPSYQLAGAHTRLFWDDDNYVQAEAAYSRSIPVEAAISNDGGLSYQPLGQSVDSGAVVVGNRLYPAERQGTAFKLKGQVALGKVFGRPATDLSARAYAQRVSRGFFTDGTLYDQGQVKYGVDGNWQVTRRDRLRLRWDGIWSEVNTVPQVGEYRQLHREIAVTQVQHQEGPFTLTGEYALTWNEDGATFGRVRYEDYQRHLGNVVAGQVDWRIHDRLVLFLRQEGAVLADQRLAPRWNDRLTTSGGARIKLVENLELNVTEAIKWNGENATTVGLRTKVDEDSDIYVAERFQARSGGWFNTSVIGASRAASPDSRTYAEYQVDHTGLGGGTSRGVMGASHQWTLMEGLTFSLGYERMQVIGASTSSPGSGPPTANPDGTVIPAAVSDSYAFGAPGANGAIAPIQGSGSRDSMFVQLGFNPWKWLKVSSRFELRYDNADERRGGYDRFIFFTANSLAWNWTDDLQFIGRFHLADVQNRTLRVTEASLQEAAVGLAYRPVHHEWFSVLGLLRHRLELRPVMLTEGRFERTTADVASIEPVLELPFGLQLVEKVAFKLSREKTDDLKEGNAFTALWINRANYHAFRLLKKFVPWFNRWPGDIDLALEYRLRTVLTSNQLDHGVVTEIGFVPVPFVRLAVGFNFSRVSDDEFAKADRNAYGPYIRMQAQY
ncbi:MAG: isopeptide-forming domain-containing fimbrial protein [Myxococcota bacterium]